jgi:hypothetical protein
LYLKKLRLAGKQAAQICLRLEEMPNVLFPTNNKVGTINPIIVPATYQGQGLEIALRSICIELSFK